MSGPTVGAVSGGAPVPPLPSSTEQDAVRAIHDNTDSLGRVDVQGLVDSIKAVGPDLQAQRDTAAAAARQIEDRGTRHAFVSALQDQGVARQPGAIERQWQGARGLATGVYEGGASLVGGVVDLGRLAGQGIAATARFGYQYATDGRYRTQANDSVSRAAQSGVDLAGRGLVAARDYASDRIAHPERLAQDASTVGQAVRSGAAVVADQAGRLYDGFDKLRSEAQIQGTTDELAGRIVGRAGFEIASLAVPASKLGLLGKGAEAAGEAGRLARGVEGAGDLARVAEGAAEQASDVAARFRGEPFAFGSGVRSARADAMVAEGARASGIQDVSKVVDVVRYEANSSSYFTVENGKRVLTVGSAAFEKTRAGQLLEAAHELAHAQVFDKLVGRLGRTAAEAEYFGPKYSFGSPLYAREEQLVERVARLRVRDFLGGLTPQQEAASTRYIDSWKAANP